MTKFILHGGNSNRKSEDNEKFLFEIIDSVEKDAINILCVYFARPEHRWEESLEEDRLAFLSLETQKKLNIEIAVSDIAEFIEQVIGADVVFLNGGLKGCLKEKLQEVGNFKKLIENEIVVGISAGANILSKYYFSSVADGIREGLGILPIKTFCHFEDENTEELQKLDEYKEKIQLYTIPEEKYIVIEI